MCSGDGARVATKHGEASPATQAKSAEVGRAPRVLVPGCAKKKAPSVLQREVLQGGAGDRVIKVEFGHPAVVESSGCRDDRIPDFCDA